jgi:hypothetical protein
VVQGMFDVDCRFLLFAVNSVDVIDCNKLLLPNHSHSYGHRHHASLHLANSGRDDTSEYCYGSDWLEELEKSFVLVDAVQQMMM